uniref:Uncharacterized protein n=1 Tax=Oryza sativa subsp. japonica TaxID=39947 RepID=Q6Z0W1_ORYSJ|nr:hypothetical protein [Oryza sativa Japonica Group]
MTGLYQNTAHDISNGLTYRPVTGDLQPVPTPPDRWPPVPPPSPDHRLPDLLGSAYGARIRPSRPLPQRLATSSSATPPSAAGFGLNEFGGHGSDGSRLPTGHWISWTYGTHIRPPRPLPPTTSRLLLRHLTVRRQIGPPPPPFHSRRPRPPLLPRFFLCHPTGSSWIPQPTASILHRLLYPRALPPFLTLVGYA